MSKKLDQQPLNQYRGDSVSHEVMLTHDDEPFYPGFGWTLRMTVKRKWSDEDEDALWQKETGAGITVASDVATVSTVEVDTETAPVTMVWDIRATETATGKRMTVALGTLTIEENIGRLPESSLEIYTKDRPVTGGELVYNRFDGHYYRLFMGPAYSGGPVTLQAEIYQAAPLDAVAPVITSRVDGSRWLVFIDETDGDGIPVLKTEQISEGEEASGTGFTVVSPGTAVATIGGVPRYFSFYDEDPNA